MAFFLGFKYFLNVVINEEGFGDEELKGWESQNVQ